MRNNKRNGADDIAPPILLIGGNGMSKEKGEAILHILDQLTKSDKEDVNIMLRVGAHLHRRDGFNLIRCAKTNEWQIVRKSIKEMRGLTNTNDATEVIQATN
ncbi:hypothetical protein ACT7CU_16600 [Bacillus paranthracis]